jgi:hypothetical protein
MIGDVFRLGVFTVVGALLGAAQFASLRSNVERYIRGDSRGSAISFHLLRLLGFAAGWVLVARFGRAPGLLSALVGFLLSRSIALALQRERP